MLLGGPSLARGVRFTSELYFLLILAESSQYGCSVDDNEKVLWIDQISHRESNSLVVSGFDTAVSPREDGVYEMAFPSGLPPNLLLSGSLKVWARGRWRIST